MSESAAQMRWRPTRAGIRNIWEYDDQVFEFADGRLVLRGPNGSGKSNALALLVPFLLDGLMAANRMDSLSGARSMKSLLLCLADDERANRFRHEQRTGYAWLEFERGDEHLTIGCGARASTQRDAEAWFFVTHLQVGDDFDLTPGGVPLSRGGLVSAIGAAAVHDSAEAHRAAVDRGLFGLGAHRYRNLIELLLVLRRPHLAGKLNLEHLSKVLSDGLAGLDDQLIAEVAASFEDLEAVKDDLRQLRDAHRTVQQFVPVYRRYLRASARTRATAATDATRALRSARQRLTAAESAVVSALDEIERVKHARLRVEEQREVADQRKSIVIGSDAFRSATMLVEVEQRAQDASRGLAGADERLATAQAEHERALSALTAATERLADASSGAAEAFTAAAASADLAGVSWPIARDDTYSADLAAILNGLATGRTQDIKDVRSALADAERAQAHAATTQATSDDASELADRRDDERQAHADDLEHARVALAEELGRWAANSTLPELHGIAGLAAVVGEPDALSLPDAVARALRPRRDELAARDARAVDRAEVLAARLDELGAERQRVADEPIPAPDRLPTRPGLRAGRIGAPLYACCDFAPAIPADERAGLEAAIEAAGLLDAWVGSEPDEQLDAWLRPATPVEGPTLADVLVPTAPDGLASETIAGVLSSIALTEAGVCVLPDGRYQLGPLNGRFAKPQAEFIGATAREERRRRLLAQLDAELDSVNLQLGEVATERTAIAAQLRDLDDLTGAVPSGGAVIAARDALVGAVAAARHVRDAAERAAGVARDARRHADEAGDRLRRLAGERRLPTNVEGLDDAAAAVHAYAQRAGHLVTAVGVVGERRLAYDSDSASARRAEDEVAARTAERDNSRRETAGLKARVDQLRVELGPDAEAPMRELEAIEAELRALRSDADRLNADASAAATAHGAAQKERELAGDGIAGAEQRVTASAARLDVLRRGDVWTVISDSAVPADAGTLAGAIGSATGDVTAGADINALERAYRQLLDDLGRGYNPSLGYTDELAVIEVTSDDGTFSVVTLGEELGNQVARQERLLSERDQEIFEHHLLTRVSEALRDLLNDADDLVTRINRSLAERPTASGKTVQLRWELDTSDATVKAALGLLRKTPELLGPEERDQLRRFFLTAINQRRAEDPALSYAEILRQVLDYRSWHIFVPLVRSAGGGTQRLTKTLFRSLSGGEQAVVLHLPLFAAAAAHYDSAAPSAPRLIALDEAFAGIDEGMRAELMGLLVRFDLDMVLTGHELWGAYEQVPSLMVYDLLRQPPLEGVSAFAVRWDGAAMAEA